MKLQRDRILRNYAIRLSCTYALAMSGISYAGAGCASMNSVPSTSGTMLIRDLPTLAETVRTAAELPAKDDLFESAPGPAIARPSVPKLRRQDAKPPVLVQPRSGASEIGNQPRCSAIIERSQL